MFLATSLGADTLPPLPSTLDDARMGIGDMYPLAGRGHVSFQIWVIRDSTKLPSSLNRRYWRRFTAEMNKRLGYLSGGQFSLRLGKVRFVALASESSLPELEQRVINQSDGRGFAMIVGPYDGGAYIRDGVFRIARDEVGMNPFNRKALHEILHGLISPAHSTSRMSTLEQYNPVIGLDPQESHFLGWPERPPQSPDSDLFD